MKTLPHLSRKLRELGFASYAAYLASEHWRTFKSHFEPRRTRNGKAVCEFCLAAHLRLDMHHRTYKRLGREKPADVVLICSQCHGRVHRWFKQGRRSLWTATRAVQRCAR